MAKNNAPDKVSITAFEDENFQKKAKLTFNPFYLPVNPESFKQNYSVESFILPGNIKNSKIGLGITPQEELRLNFIFDGTNAIEGYKYNGKDHTVQAQLELFLDTVFNRKEKIQKPYFLTVQWGNFSFSGVLGKLDLNYTMFDPKGSPLRIYVKTIFVNPRSLQILTEKESANSNVSTRIQDLKFPERPPAVNIKFKPPLLNLPIVYPRAKTSKSVEEKTETGELPYTGNTLLCPNAGVVLVHPFLQKSLEKLNLLKNGKFRNKKCRQQAILFTHYLATGRENFLENEHFIPHLLCGLPPEQDPPQNIYLNPVTKEEAENLLHNAINTWGALGNTSSDSLRRTFLSREGRLEIEIKSTNLRLPSTSLDILLDKLPWNLSIVKFPWMQSFLSVRWR